MLVDKGANINAVDKDNDSALMYAAINGNAISVYICIISTKST